MAQHCKESWTLFSRTKPSRMRNRLHQEVDEGGVRMRLFGAGNRQELVGLGCRHAERGCRGRADGTEREVTFGGVWCVLPDCPTF